jgi:hypothetical protein
MNIDKNNSDGMVWSFDHYYQASGHITNLVDRLFCSNIGIHEHYNSFGDSKYNYILLQIRSDLHYVKQVVMMSLVQVKGHVINNGYCHRKVVFYSNTNLLVDWYSKIFLTLNMFEYCHPASTIRFTFHKAIWISISSKSRNFVVVLEFSNKHFLNTKKSFCWLPNLLSSYLYYLKWWKFWMGLFHFELVYLNRFNFSSSAFL